MRLKSLEIKGFKSFADKTVINFDEGITGIIGPNGCGKSNIVDSIRWVIGEQKISNLRSENLDSLVFNGSKSRSASGLAEVSLTFENTRNLLPTEFSTVTVSRRFYKNGDSEYRLNDVQCRMKDIHNLFLDTGISTDSYAIIELGMVDDIIKDKDNSRRRMLEQAAGISIYKTRKKEAKNKLDATEQDLARIEDLLFEIHNQLKTLENQAKKAEKYYEIKKEFRILSIELAKASLQGFQLKYKNLSEQQIVESDRKLGLETEIATEDAALESERVGFVEEERKLQAMQQAFNQLVQTLRTRENEKNLAKQQLAFLHEKEQGLVDFLDKSRGQLESLKDGVLHTDKQMQVESDVLENLQRALQTQSGELAEKRGVFEQQKKVLDTERTQLNQLQRLHFDAEKNYAVADTGIVNIQRGIAQLQDEVAQRTNQIQAADTDKNEREAELDEKKSELADLQSIHEKAKSKILEGQAALENLRQQLMEQNRVLDQRRNEYALLKNLIESMEGYPDSVKFLHKNPNWNHHAPILSDIIYVKEPYRAAVENVLEPYLNYYVVSDLQEGLEAVNLLEANQKGKANFFLLDKINAFESGQESQPLKETTPVLEVIEVEPRYKKLAEHLLGQVLIADNDGVLENTTSHTIIEKSGKYVKGKYTLTGGSVGLFEGKKIGRAKNLEKIQAEIAKQETVVDLLKEQISKKHAEVLDYNTQLKEQAIRQTEQEILQLTNAVFAAQNKKENLQHLQESASKRINQYQDQLDTQQEAIADIRETLQDLSEQLEQQRFNLGEAENNYRSSEQAYQSAAGLYNEANIGVARQQSKLDSLNQELRFKQQQVTNLEKQISDSKAQLETIGTQLFENKEQLSQSEAELAELIRRKEVDEKALNETDRNYYNKRNQLQDRESALRLKIKAKENVDHVLEKIKDELNNLKLQLAGIKERLDVEFRINIDDIIDEARESDTPVEELQAAADRMKKRLENLGEVNPTAIEAYQEMKVRYEFILEQKNDLVNAKESLMQTIQEVESTANRQFLETFNAVRENFIKVFKALFTEEDAADMILENPENLAETGIDIIAKPKGKRPSSITQLSGGEKTLTATALLFAIYLIKPAPFCILDEVDAPLDDANVGKFTQMIRKFSENSQFIIVTHNKQTMGAVDVIYGVTMQEAGVSKLVPVDFRSLN